MPTPKITRRAALAGAAALPALSLPARAENPSDPAVAAVQRWLAAREAENSYDDPGIPDDEPKAAALRAEEERRWQELIGTLPQTAAGLALMLAAFAYDAEAIKAGARFHHPDTWFVDDPDDVQSTARRLLPALWRSPAAAEIFASLEPAA